MGYIPKKGEIYFPDMLYELADIVGGARVEKNKELRPEGHKANRGEDALRIDILGARAEMIFRHFLWTHNHTHESALLLDERPVVGWDVRIGPALVDVKGMPEGLQTFYVNKDAHENPNKNITHYAFVQETGHGRAEYSVFSHEDVDNWEVRELKYSDAYCLDV